eukprot:CAMPEP_0195577568 /NCGR_PEP_ID=MMETSP0814-20130614/10660_1 /TAXON_ID=97485 /ORGANISM="Prymnesium parvum, Strain Texoma1" /LENGTH=326 /DNA_ID=CAMNT_0040713977 /DNA_START=16 /DNA_END=996 /DNA_ORIENTATION=-
MGCAVSKGSAELEVAEKELTKLALRPELRKIHAGDNKLTELPASIGECQQLVLLDVSGNQLTTLPEEIGKCHALEEILCFKNQIKELPASLNGANLPALKILNLFNNKLRKVPDELGTLASVEEVNIAGNKLMALSDAAFAKWKAVRILNLYDNNLVRIGSLEPLTALMEIRLYGNNLEDAPAISRMADLEVFEMHKNRVAAIPDDYFTKTPNLKRLVLSNNLLKTLPSSILSCSSLKQLQVQDNKMTSIPSGAWPTSLETVFLQGNQELTELPAELAQCTNLSRVNVSKLALSESSLTVAAQLQKICCTKQGGVFWDPNGRQLNA